jgi:hypothetical protein
MGKISGDNRMLEKSKTVVQLIYYTLAVILILLTIWFTLILPNIDFLTNQITNNTFPLPP